MEKKYLQTNAFSEKKKMGHSKQDWWLASVSRKVNGTMMKYFAIAAIKNFLVVKVDINTTFLYSEIKISEGFEEEGKICKFNKALYGLTLKLKC